MLKPGRKSDGSVGEEVCTFGRTGCPGLPRTEKGKSALSFKGYQEILERKMKTGF